MSSRERYEMIEELELDQYKKFYGVELGETQYYEYKKKCLSNDDPYQSQLVGISSIIGLIALGYLAFNHFGIIENSYAVDNNEPQMQEIIAPENLNNNGLEEKIIS